MRLSGGKVRGFGLKDRHQKVMFFKRLGAAIRAR